MIRTWKDYGELRSIADRLLAIDPPSGSADYERLNVVLPLLVEFECRVLLGLCPSK